VGPHELLLPSEKWDIARREVIPPGQGSPKESAIGDLGVWAPSLSSTLGDLSAKLKRERPPSRKAAVWIRHTGDERSDAPAARRRPPGARGPQTCAGFPPRRKSSHGPYRVSRCRCRESRRGNGSSRDEQKNPEVRSSPARLNAEPGFKASEAELRNPKVSLSARTRTRRATAAPRSHGKHRAGG